MSAPTSPSSRRATTTTVRAANWCATTSSRGATTTRRRAWRWTRQELREAFERAVHRQMMTDVPYGVLLSGGLDSSLVAAVRGALCAQAHRGQRRQRSVVAAPALVRDRPGGFARPGRGRDRRRGAGHRAPRLHLHLRRRTGCAAGSDPPHRDLRRDHDPRLHADVPAGAADQGDGREDGALGRGQRRDLRRLPVLPQGAERARVPRGNRAQDRRAATTTTACAPTSR